MGAFTINNQAEVRRRMEEVFTLFPRLKERSSKKAEHSQAASSKCWLLARGLMLKPHILLMDEPSMGLAPVLVDAIFDVIARLTKTGPRSCWWSRML